MVSLRAEDVLAWRMGRALLGRARRAATPVPDVARAVCGLHAQVTSSSALAAWARIDGLAPGAVDEAVESGALVKTWAVRGTLHLLPAVDLPLWAAALRRLPERHRAAAWQRYHGVTAEQVDLALEALPEVLSARPLTREELGEALATATGREDVRGAAADSWGAVVKLAAMRGDLVFGPPRGRNVTFVAPPAGLAVDEDVACAEIAARYLRAHGPATRERFARWFGFSSAPRAERLLRCAPDLAAVEVGGVPMLALGEDVASLEQAAPAGDVALLPAFDPYVAALPRDDETALPAEHRGAVFRPQGWLTPVVLVDGRVAGTWSHEVREGVAEVTVTPFAPLGAEARAAVDAEAARLAPFVRAADARVRGTGSS
jgi:hypothetical protein